MEIKKLIMFLSISTVIITSITLITGVYALRIGGGGGRPAGGARPGGGAPGAQPSIGRPGRPDGGQAGTGIGRPGRPGGVGTETKPGIGRPGGDGRPGRPDHRPGPGRPGHHHRPGKDVNIYLGGTYGLGYPYYGGYNGYGYSPLIGPFYAYLTAQQAELPSVYCPQACKYSPDNPGKSWTGQSFWDETYGFTCVCA